MYETSRITIRNDSDSIEGVVEYIRFIAAKLGLNEKERYRICYAVEECLQNSILFSFEADEEQAIDIDLNRIAAGMEIVIRDQGLPRNPFVQVPQSIEEIASDLSLEHIAEKDGDRISAVTDFVIHKLLDRYTYKNLGKEGRSIEMVLYASEARINEELLPTSQAVSAADAIFSGIRNPKPEDITGISRLFHKSYGYSYVNDVVYYPERLEKKIASGELISAVALSDSGQVVGHISLAQPFEGAQITEWGMAICDPLFRGQGVMSRLIEAIMEQANRSAYHGVFSHSVTNHGFTQKICKVHGFSDVALLVGYAGSELSFKKIHNTLPQRETTIINFKPLKPGGEAELFSAEKHQEMIAALYGGIGIRVSWRTAETSAGNKTRTELTDTVIPALNIAEVVLGQVGSEAREQLIAVTRKLCIAGVDLIYLFIDLEDARAVSLIEELEQSGYFFGGIFPCYHHQHTLVMQYVNNLQFDYELMVAHTPLAQELKEYVRGLDPNQNL
ncbi:GNAT family N-acetyltransferase [Desulfogranum mediterraneum]|uniref:GNAT family N-acetyltransferase n=1 Tax=Desulfogranum mediterraneum TaxID=160661 RepID=UPI000418B1D6|nr:GNAT family N-acetyltransferase [Desulfogranum mediterraneum]